jgi:ElaB/YqjD/DUF883 family membrane-anchored ribosome-binding protein
MRDATQIFTDGQKRLAKDFKNVVDDAEELLRHTARDTGKGYGEARERLERTLRSARGELKAMEAAVVDGARRTGRAADGYVHKYPWESIGIGAGIGLLVGFLVARR